MQLQGTEQAGVLFQNDDDGGMSRCKIGDLVNAVDKQVGDATIHEINQSGEDVDGVVEITGASADCVPGMKAVKFSPGAQEDPTGVDADDSDVLTIG